MKKYPCYLELTNKKIFVGADMKIFAFLKFPNKNEGGNFIYIKYKENIYEVLEPKELKFVLK